MKKLLFLCFIASPHAWTIDQNQQTKKPATADKPNRLIRRLRKIAAVQLVNLVADVALNAQYPNQAYENELYNALSAGAHKSLSLGRLSSAAITFAITDDLARITLANHTALHPEFQKILSTVASIGLTGLTYTASYFIKNALHKRGMVPTF